jgi:hypothetical protein
MNILEELRELQKQHKKPEENKKEGDAYISDAVVFSTLYRLGVDEQIINDVILEPYEKREEWLSYFENVGKK